MADFIGSNSGTPIKGTNTNDNAAAGNIGETISSAVGATALPTSNQYGDLTSISLTAGDWLVCFMCAFNTSTSTTTLEAGISTTTGNSSTGLTIGDTLAVAQFSVATNSYETLTIPYVRMSLSTTTTVYAKFFGIYTGTPTALGRITALRIR